MNLKKKKELASRLLGIGKSRIVFIQARSEDIKEALTKQDIRDLVLDKAIIIKDVKGRKKIKKKVKKTTGNIRKKVNTRKQVYVKMTRKLRGYTNEVKKQGKLSREEVIEIRKKIRNRNFKSKANLKEYIEQLTK